MDHDLDALLRILPPEIRRGVACSDQSALQEIRLRRDRPGELVTAQGSQWLSGICRKEDLDHVVNGASKFSPWSVSTVAQGYITISGGHRIGLCGDAVMQHGVMTALRRVDSLCIRVARDLRDLAKGLPLRGSLLFLGPPGSGKTTLLRDLIRHRSRKCSGAVAVVDERGELFPPGFDPGCRTDVLQGTSKAAGLDMVLRSMGPNCIAVDEITSPLDCDAVIQVAGCGVDLLATAHGSSVEDLCRRPIYRRLMEANIFANVVILQQDKSWRMERMNL